MTLDEAFTRLLGSEGGYSNDPLDPGGETMWGITKTVAMANGYQGDMKDYPQSEAKRVYKAKYWDPIHGDELFGSVAFNVFDAAVNSGTDQAVRWLQQSLGVPVDGVLGPVTLKAASLTPPLAVLVQFNSLRLAFLTDLPGWFYYGRGWAKRIARNLII